MKLAFILVIALVFTGKANPLQKALNTINSDRAAAYVCFLSSDLMQGRKAGTASAQLTAEYLASYLKAEGIQPFFNGYTQSFEAYAAQARYSVVPDSIAKYKQGKHKIIQLNNIAGIIPGTDTSQYVIIGAHFDHLGVDPDLAGDKIYNGADDNASGVSAVMQIARAFVESGVKPKRNIVFAFWDGEESGCLGSRYFVQNFHDSAKIKGYLNFDMLGRNSDEENPQGVAFFYTEKHKAFENWLKDDIEEHKLALKPDYKPWDNPIGGSDNGPFAAKGVPVMWYHTNGHADYHQPGDECDKINLQKLTAITKAAFLGMWKLANEKQF